MDVPPLDEERIDPPPRAVTQRYLSLDPPRTFNIRELRDAGFTSSKARLFASQAAKARISVRLERGEYLAVDPSIAVRAWGLPSYYADLLVLHEAATFLDVEHAFACLTANLHSDLMFQRPWMVTKPNDNHIASKIERFSFDFQSTTVETLNTLGASLELPELSIEETALLLGATGLPREREASRAMTDAHPPPDHFAPWFNHYGIDLGSDVIESKDPGIRFPAFIEHRRERFGEALLREGPR